ncbi:MAG: zinc-binding dehydrogenase [Chloroflexi bacterium]|nr:zinc-binding dehydrogenase [Chloroflexota bacterium]
MLAARLPGDRTVLLEREADPTPGTGQVVIAMKASGVCGSDLSPYRASKEDRARQARGGKLNISGHEPCGVVAEIGAGVTDVKVGDRVIVHHYSGCGRCKYCLTGWPQLCVAGGHKVYGFNADGGNSDLMLALSSMCVPMPDQLSFGEGAAIACGTGTAYQALKRLNVNGLDTLAVYGQGPVGLSATLLGAAMGARVIAIDPDEKRLELASRHGASVAINPRKDDPVQAIKQVTHGEGADAALDATGIGPVRRQMVQSVKVWGRAVLVGEGGDVTFAPSPEIIHKHLTLMGSWTFSTVVVAELARWVVDRQIPLNDIITHRFPLSRANEAFELFEDGGTGKVIFEWD